MQENWYYSENQQPKGPVSRDELMVLLANGTIPATTLLWHAGLSQWRVAAEFPELFHSPAAESELVSINDSIKMPEHKIPVVEGFPSEPSGAPERPQSFLPGRADSTRLYAGFWLRFFAKLLDDLIYMLILLPLSLLFAGMLAFLNEPFSISGSPENFGHSFLLLLYTIGAHFSGGLLLKFVYSGFFLSFYGATPGKMALGMQVLRSDGSRVSFLRGGCRYLAELLSISFFFLGYLMVLFDEKKRALHDHLCDTRVLRK
ncbi:MAG: RDD family protein [Lentisphaeria bacterium]